MADDVLKLFEQTGAYLKGHFRLTSGLHSPEYLQCALVLRYPAHAESLGRALAAELEKLTGGRSIDIVVSPAMGGVVIGHEVGRALGVPAIFTERENGIMTLRRGFRIEPGATAVVVEDVVTTGGSTREVIDLLRGAGAQILAAGSIIDRSGGAVDLGVPRAALATMKVTSWTAEACPLCAQGSPVVKPGSRSV
ncbi:MAG TPA: orotate phosphoribosyltransferase [Bryobacteraceae bacterium]